MLEQGIMDLWHLPSQDRLLEDLLEGGRGKLWLGWTESMDRSGLVLVEERADG